MRILLSGFTFFALLQIAMVIWVGIDINYLIYDTALCRSCEPFAGGSLLISLNNNLAQLILEYWRIWYSLLVVSVFGSIGTAAYLIWKLKKSETKNIPQIPL